MNLTLLFTGFFVALSGCCFDLILGNLEDIEEHDFNTIKIIEKYGYPAETHLIETEDGYFLQIQRIPHGKNSTGTSSKQPFLFLHGIFTSSNGYLAMGLDSLPFLLADRGYDVWLGNFRGTQYGNLHRTLSSKTSEFWNFSFHEVGLYDLPAQIDYICNYTKRNNVTLLGHSFGTTVQMVMATEKPDYQKKVRASVLIGAPSLFYKEKKLLPLLAPVYPFVYSKSFTNRELSGQMLIVRTMLLSLGFLGKRDLWMYLLSLKSSIQEYARVLLAGKQHITSCRYKRLKSNVRISNAKLVTFQMAYFIFHFYSSSTSVKVITHYFQFGVSGKVRQYDYGPAENLIKYKSREPPAYNLESITIPMALIFAPDDIYACKEDSEYLLKRMKNIKMVLELKDRKFTHLNFQYGANIKELIYNKVLVFIENLEKL